MLNGACDGERKSGGGEWRLKPNSISSSREKESRWETGGVAAQGFFFFFGIRHRERLLLLLLPWVCVVVDGDHTMVNDVCCEERRRRPLHLTLASRRQNLDLRILSSLGDDDDADDKIHHHHHR